MQQPQCLVFGPFRLDVRDERLWRGHEAIPLSPKTFAVLCCLVSQAGQLVTKDALLEAVWPETIMSESILTVAMRTLRRVLGDQARTPRFIETVHGRGYRFIAPVSATMPPERPAMLERPGRSIPSMVSRPPLFVGRDAELTQMAQWWTTVQQGQRQVGMIVGEPGIGKTALVEIFVAQVCATEDVWVGHGQCMDPYGAGEAYLPVLEALGRLGRGPEGAPLIAVLRQYAPSWLVHLSALLAPEDRERLEHTTSGATPARMLRELAEALEVLTAARPLVLVLEDLHWSDRATLEWLAYVVRRRDPARLLLLGTYRPVDVIVHAPALRAIVAEIRHHPQYAELILDYLSEAAITAYLWQRCGVKPVSPGLPQLLHQRTSGNPLFLVAMVDELVRRRLLETAEDTSASQGALAVLSEVIPTSLWQYIEQHLEQLSEADQTLLEAASVAGSTFAVAAVAAGVAQAPETLEARLTALARHRQFIRASGTERWPDGTVTACYTFRHALYHEVVYGRVSAGHRVRLHQQIGARKEAGYGALARQIATELAVHFTRGRDAGRAVHYLHAAADHAMQRSAYQEAITHLTTGLELLTTLPDTLEHRQQELALQITLGAALTATKGLAAPDVGAAYQRARALCQQVGEPPQLFPVLAGLVRFYNGREEFQTMREIGEQMLNLAQYVHDPAGLAHAQITLGNALLSLQEWDAARTHLEQGVAFYTAPQHRAQGFLTETHQGVIGLRCLAIVLWALGYPDQALQRSYEALTLARELAHPASVVTALFWAAQVHSRRREWQRTYEQAEAALGLAREHGFAFRVAQATLMRGWALVQQGQGEAGLTQICQGLTALRDTGSEVGAYLIWLAAAYGRVGQREAGLRVAEEALAISRRNAAWYCLKGVLLLRRSTEHHAEAESCFRQALEIAHRQQAKSLELRAATSLSRLWQCQGKRAAAYDLLAPVYGWFTEGFDTADLQEAGALLEDLRA
jgi:DNA-binding winged helix-turn-helix (wHTH) protein/tetratricopeptide (TPR) repeat protein